MDSSKISVESWLSGPFSGRKQPAHERKRQLNFATLEVEERPSHVRDGDAFGGGLVTGLAGDRTRCGASFAQQGSTFSFQLVDLKCAERGWAV